MAEKKLYTKPEFDELLVSSAEGMSQDKDLKKKAMEVLVEADKHRWIHQTKWFGQAILNLPQDMFAIQEIIYRTRPKFIIETGVAWGGSLLFYSTLMEVLGGEKIIGIDLYMPPDLKERLNSYGKLSSRLALIEGSSVDESTVERVRSITGGSKEVMLILDSYHTHEHVLKELRLYSPFVGKGFYIVCGDTVVEDIPEQTHRTRPWGPGDNPKTALRQFLLENDRFIVDKKTENKLLFTCNPDGYVQCVKD